MFISAAHYILHDVILDWCEFCFVLTKWFYDLQFVYFNFIRLMSWKINLISVSFIGLKMDEWSQNQHICVLVLTKWYPCSWSVWVDPERQPGQNNKQQSRSINSHQVETNLSTQRKNHLNTGVIPWKEKKKIIKMWRHNS